MSDGRGRQTYDSVHLTAVTQAIRTLAAVSGEVADWYEQSVLSSLKGIVEESTLDLTLRGTLLRLAGWLNTAAKCEISDVQAVMAGARASYELLADIATLTMDPHRLEEMIDWENSAKLKAIGKQISAFEFDGEVPPNEWIQFVNNNRERIEKLRTRRWPSKDIGKPGRHPSRWTDSSLVAMLSHCRTVIGEGVVRGFLRSDDLMNWAVHGSSLQFGRGTPTHVLASHCGAGLSTIPRCALRAASIVIEFHKMNVASSVFEENELVLTRRVAVAVQSLRKAMTDQAIVP